MMLLDHVSKISIFGEFSLSLGVTGGGGQGHFLVFKKQGNVETSVPTDPQFLL